MDIVRIGVYSNGFDNTASTDKEATVNQLMISESGGKYTPYQKGNIGVTTSQMMLQSELDIARWNLYEHIADLFCQEFCIMVY